MDIAALATYGGPFEDETVVKNPQTQQSAAKGNRALEDCAQMTRTSVKMTVHFQTRGSNGTCTVTGARSHFGTGVSQQPVVTRTAAGKYTFTLAATYTDDTGAVETVALYDVDGRTASNASFGQLHGTVSANVATTTLVDYTGAASDLGGGIDVIARLY